MKINCIVVDDEPLALQLLQEYVHKTPFLHLVGACSNAISALELIESNDVDLIFSDIQMPDLTGLDFSRIIKKKCQVVLTTAYSEFALEGFRVGALDYLLKPFNYQEFLSSAQRALEWKSLAENSTATTAPRFIFVKADYKLVRINFDDIIYIEGLKDYVKFFIRSQAKPILSLMSLKFLEAELPSSEFMRVQRSFIVALSAIDAIDKGQLIVGNQYIAIADQYKDRLNDYVRKRYSQ